MTFFVGIDGGGTKTRCAVGDDLSVFGEGEAGGCNVVRLGSVAAKSAIQSAIHNACARAGVSAAQVSRTCIGVAGISAPGVSQSLAAIISEVVSGSVEVVGDQEIALEAAFGDGPGVLIVAGTGSIACGRNSVGQRARAGGYGYAVSDEGSGHWIGRLAVSRTLATRDSGENTCLESLISETWGIEARELVRAANASPAPDFSKLFPAVVAASEKGDAVAIGVLEHAADELVRLAQSVIRRLWTDSESPSLAFTGGVFEHSSLVRNRFSQRLRSQCPNCEIQPDIVDPALGALSLARRGAHKLNV